MAPVTKTYPTFDCDAHINDPAEIWTKYIPEGKKDIVRALGYWAAEEPPVVNGRPGPGVTGSRRAIHTGAPFNLNDIAGPGMNAKLQRRLSQMQLTPEQVDYLVHRGAYEAKARVKDLDLQGIDQVLVIPTRINAGLPLTENAEAAKVLAEAYNDWAADWCSEAPDRLFPAGVLPLQNPSSAVSELRRIAGKGFRVGLIRPVDVKGGYPNRIFSAPGNVSLDAVFRTFEETGLVCGMHTFSASISPPPGDPLDSWPVSLQGRYQHASNRRSDCGLLVRSGGMAVPGLDQRLP